MTKCRDLPRAPVVSSRIVGHKINVAIVEIRLIALNKTPKTTDPVVDLTSDIDFSLLPEDNSSMGVDIGEVNELPENIAS